MVAFGRGVYLFVGLNKPCGEKHLRDGRCHGRCGLVNLGRGLRVTLSWARYPSPATPPHNPTPLHTPPHPSTPPHSPLARQIFSEGWTKLACVVQAAPLSAANLVVDPPGPSGASGGPLGGGGGMGHARPRARQTTYEVWAVASI